MTIDLMGMQFLSTVKSAFKSMLVLKRKFEIKNSLGL